MPPDKMNLLHNRDVFFFFGFLRMRSVKRGLSANEHHGKTQQQKV